jgi:hypothetical protein
MRTKVMVRGAVTGFLVLLLLTALVLTALPVQAIPQPGHHFYGNVTGAEPGAVISAKIRGIEYATTSVDTRGRYGYSPRFEIPADDYGTRRVIEGGRVGDVVKFYIQDTLVGQAPFIIWGMTKLDLSLYDDVELTVTSVGNGSTDPSGTALRPYGEVVSVTATADPCYELDYWGVNGVASGSENPLSITMDGDYSVTAYFAEIEYCLTLESGPNGDITDPLEGTYNYPCDTEVWVTATPDSGHELDYWEVNDDVVSGSENPLSITMDGDCSVTAYFASNGEGEGSNSGNTGSSGDDNDNEPPLEGSLEGSLVAIVFIPGSEEDIGAALARIACGLETCSGGVQTVYLYDPGDANGPWVEQIIPCTE